MQNTASAPRYVREHTTPLHAHDGLRGTALVGLLLLLGFAGSAMGDLIRVRPTGSELNGAAWEGRRLIAQMLWLKTHAVLHAGVEERDARPGEEVTRAGEFHSATAPKSSGAAEHAGHAHEGGQCEHESHGHEGHSHEGHKHDETCNHEKGHVLVIPPAREDFRGVLGNLERAVKPYAGRDGQLFSKDADQMLPFYRMVTWADPHFVEGYTVGATFICRAGKYADRGLEFLHEGERGNPGSFEIQTELGHFYLVYKKDYATAEKHLLRALELMPRARVLTAQEKDAQADAFRWLALNYRQWRKPQQAVAIALRGRMIIGNDVTLEKVLHNKGL
ncbi:MAG TPA: hypothetical protein VK689_08230 [Armatimonadota bacterium]|nr:hypothetical protein [Armatimonadota bacterium]